MSSSPSLRNTFVTFILLRVLFTKPFNRKTKMEGPGAACKFRSSSRTIFSRPDAVEWFEMGRSCKPLKGLMFAKHAHGKTKLDVGMLGRSVSERGPMSIDTTEWLVAEIKLHTRFWHKAEIVNDTRSYFLLKKGRLVTILIRSYEEECDWLKRGVFELGKVAPKKKTETSCECCL